MLLRASTWIKAAMLVTLCALVIGCKPRTSGSGLKDGPYDSTYRGPMMSDPACAADPAKCLCVLGNEFDAPEWKGKKEWFRQCIGQEIWYKATGGGGRFHTYYAAQKLNVLGDYGWVMHTSERAKRFDNWGVINDPDCCRPNSPGQSDGNCSQKYPGLNITTDDTYGLDYCPGDDVLLKYVGDATKDYTEVDPACNISRLEDKINFKVRIGGGDDNGPRRVDSCYLAFGTSSGTVNMRKFPNPRFDKEKWRKLNNGSLSSWENYSRRTASGKPDYGPKGGKQRIDDGSIEPPFLFGQSCGSCHIGFAPTKPPANPNDPAWENIHGVIGNSFIHFAELLGAGTAIGTIEHQAFLHTRAGVVDTSAATNDYVHNDGTFNAIINFDRRPGFLPEKLKGQQGATFDRFVEDVTTYRQQSDGSWRESTEKERIAHVLKGGEDSASVTAGVLRVYLNIFSCTATCLANHLDDLKVLDGRGSRQTPIELDQCRNDCPAYASLESRVYDEIDFLLHVRPQDLKNAKDPPNVEGGKDGAEIVKEIMEKKVDGGEPGSWYEAGKQVFGEKCAKCHSSLPGQDSKAGLVDGGSVREIDVNKFVANVDKKDENGVRLDWLGSDVLIPQQIVGTFRCRALHSNHMEGHIWEAYGSDTYRGKQRYAAADNSLFNYPAENLTADVMGGRGFYRNISLLNVWAHAPFMHNNALGWEWKHPLFDIDRGSPTEWKKLTPIPTVKQRLRMFEESMKSLFTPEDQRERTGSYPFKVTLTSAPIKLFVAPSIPDIPDGFWSLTPGAATVTALKQALQTLTIEVPKGMPVVLISSLRHKQLYWDLMEAIKTQPTQEKKVLAAKAFLQGIFGSGLSVDPDKIAKNLVAKKYVNCADIYDNRGHEFGDLSETEKAQIIDFMKTL